MQGLKIIMKNDEVHLSGHIDEGANLTPLLALKQDRLVLNLADLKSMNSLGIRVLISFIKDWSPREFAFREAPLFFIDTVNMFEALLGRPPVPARMESFYVPYVGEHEQDQGLFLVKYEDLITDSGIITAPIRNGAFGPMHFDGDPDDFFLFAYDD